MDEIQRSYYSIQEVSKMFSVPYSTLRYWEKCVKQLKPRTVNQTRYYAPEDLETIRAIIYLRAQNVPVAELSKRITLDKKHLDKKGTILVTLQQVKQELLELRDMI